MVAVKHWLLLIDNLVNQVKLILKIKKRREKWSNLEAMKKQISKINSAKQTQKLFSMPQRHTEPKMSPAKWFERIRKGMLKANPYWRKKGGQGGVREAQLRPEKYRNYSLRPNSMMLLIRYSWQNVLIAQIASLTMLIHS